GAAQVAAVDHVDEIGRVRPADDFDESLERRAANLRAGPRVVEAECRAWVALEITHLAATRRRSEDDCRSVRRIPERDDMRGAVRLERGKYPDEPLSEQLAHERVRVNGIARQRAARRWSSLLSRPPALDSTGRRRARRRSPLSAER